MVFLPLFFNCSSLAEKGTGENKSIVVKVPVSME
jgi:hypothetical protein